MALEIDIQEKIDEKCEEITDWYFDKFIKSLSSLHSLREMKIEWMLDVLKNTNKGMKLQHSEVPFRIESYTTIKQMWNP